MLSGSTRAATFLALALLVACGGRASAGQVSLESAEGAPPPVSVTMDEERRLIVEDPANRYHLSLPGPYWECKTPSQIAGGGPPGQGCAGPTRLPPGLLLAAHNKDGPVQAAFYLLPERFLLRGKDDLDTYLAARQQQVQPRRGAAMEFLEPSFRKRDGVMIHCAPLVLSARGRKIRAVLVHYFVRPRDEDVHVYRLEVMVAEEEFDRCRDEVEHIIASFGFTGELSQQFFVPDAADERLPDLTARPGGAMACGQGRWPMLLAGVGVFMIYMFIRRRRSRPAV